MLHRIENLIALGTPDVLYTLRARSGLIETKASISTLTREQVLFGEQWSAAGGLWHLMLHADKEWFLFDAQGARELFTRSGFSPILRAKGKFPLKQMIQVLSPCR